MVRQGDEQWFNIVRWTMYAMMEAENTASPPRTWTRC